MTHKFYVVLKSQLFSVTTSDDDRFEDTLESLKSTSAAARRILGRTTHEQCDYYMLKNPVRLPDKTSNTADIISECTDPETWEKVHHMDSLKILAQPVTNDYVYIVINPPEGMLEPQDDLGIFGTDAIQAILKKMNYKIDFIPYPLIAAVSNATSAHEPENGYLKFVKEGGKEIEILQYLTGVDSPANHTISGVRIWPVRGGNVISMPVAGARLTSLTKPSAHLWSVAIQLFEAVDFMHQHGVAHMDLKPNNILIPVNGGRLTVIDFNRSLRVKGVEHRFRGVVGTPEYIAPEVDAGNGPWSAIRADLWSCGKTLEELCDKCRPSTDRDTLLEISSQLMDEDPKKRPMMAEVLDRLTRCTVDTTTRPGSSM